MNLNSGLKQVLPVENTEINRKILNQKFLKFQKWTVDIKIMNSFFTDHKIGSMVWDLWAPQVRLGFW